jgi:hypothetical protein
MQNTFATLKMRMNISKCRAARADLGGRDCESGHHCTHRAFISLTLGTLFTQSNSHPNILLTLSNLPHDTDLCISYACLSVATSEWYAICVLAFFLICA